MRMTQKNLEKWAKTRQMGRSRFVRLYWTLGWGLTTGAVWGVLMGFEEGWTQLPIFLILGLIGFPIGGCFLGRWMWTLNERSFKNASQNT
jgi:hypothetical protein